MHNCFEIRSQNELHKLLIRDGVNIALDGKNLSRYRTTMVYHIKNGQIILVPGGIYPNCNGLLVKNDTCLNDLLKFENLPIDNPDKNFLEDDKEKILNIGNNILYYTSYLNSITDLKYDIVDKNNYKYYYNNILKLYKSNKKEVSKATVALLVVAGEIVRKERKGSWMLIKKSGIFNPYFEPAILLDNNEFIELPFIILRRLRNGLAYDEMYMKDMLNAKTRDKVSSFFEDKNDYIILTQ